MAHGEHMSFDEAQNEGRAVILDDAVAMFHGLWCKSCNLRTQVLAALTLVGWSEADFMEQVNLRLGVFGGDGS